MLSKITPLILTFNEEANIERTLERLDWADRIVVVDSFSTDGTLNVLRKCARVEVFQRTFDDHTSQWNFGLDLVKTEWVLSLDADYILSEGLIDELRRLDSEFGIDAYFIPFRYCVHGRRLRATLYPPRAALFRCGQNRYVPDGHTQLLAVKGRAGKLNCYIDHDDRKPLFQWLLAQDRYAVLEVAKLRVTPNRNLPMQDVLRKFILPAPLAVFFYVLLVKGIILEGWAGWYYVIQRTMAEAVLSLRLIETKLHHSADREGARAS